MAVYDVQPNPVPAVLRAICDRLRNRASLQTARISRHDFDPSKGGDMLFLVNGMDDPEWASNGRMRVRHMLLIKGQILVVREGNSDAVADECMDRAYEMLHEMELEFRGKDDGHVLLGLDGRPLAIGTAVTRHEWDAGMLVVGTARVFKIDFEISVQSDTMRTS